MEIIKRGIAVSPGVAIGPALLLDTEGFRIPKRLVEAGQTAAEVERLRRAFDEAGREARDSQRQIAERLGIHYGSIFGAHAELLENAYFRGEIEQLITGQRFAAEYALSQVMRRYAKALQDLGPEKTAAGRAADLFDIEKRLLGHLLGQRREEIRQLCRPVIVLAHDLTPS